MSEPYVKINAILSIILLAIFAYSFLYPALAQSGLIIPSSCEGLPLVYCKSRGLTRAFAAITHGNMDEAKRLNAHSIPIFLFFAIQAAARLIFSVIFAWKKSNGVIYTDAIISTVYFLIVFSPLTMTQS